MDIPLSKSPSGVPSNSLICMSDFPFGFRIQYRHDKVQKRGLPHTPGAVYIYLPGAHTFAQLLIWRCNPCVSFIIFILSNILFGEVQTSNVPSNLENIKYV